MPRKPIRAGGRRIGSGIYLETRRTPPFLGGWGTDGWGISITGPLAALGGSPPGSWSIGFETDGFARAATAPVRP